jgi:hypothetical protein
LNENSDFIWALRTNSLTGGSLFGQFIGPDLPNLGLAKGLPGSGIVIASLLPAFLLTDALIAFILFRR